MTLSRIVLYCLGLLLLCLLALGSYIYLQFPQILGQQAKQYLQEYGVRDIDLEEPRVSAGQFTAKKIWLTGDYQGLAFTVTLNALELRYDWHMLLNGQLESVTIAQLELALEEKDASSNTAPTAISVSSILPQTFMAQLPVQSLAITQWEASYQAPGQPLISGSGRLRIADQLTLELASTHHDSHIFVELWTGPAATSLGARLALRDGDTPITQLNLQLEQIPDENWRWTLDAELEYANVLAWLRRLDRDTDLTLDVSALDSLTLIGGSTISAEIVHPDKLSLVSEPVQPGVLPPILEQITATISLDNDITQVDYATVIKGLSGQLHTTVELTAGLLKMSMAPTRLTGNIWADQLGLPQETLTWLGLEQLVPLHWQNPEALTIRSASENVWSLQLRNSMLALGNKGTELRLETLNLDASIQPSEALQLHTELNTSIKTRLNKQQLPQMKLQLKQDGHIADSTFNLSLGDTAQSISLDLRGTVNGQTGRGDYALNARSLDLPYAAGTVLPLLQHFKVLQQEVEILSGDITLATSFTSQSFDPASFQQQSQLTIRDISGSYDEYRFEGAALAAHWRGIEHWKTLKPIELSMAQLDIGFVLVDILALVDLPKPTPIVQPLVYIEKFSAGMFGGRLYLPQPRQWDFGARTNKMTLRAEQWQLADMVALQQDQDIQAQGRLEGELPVTMTGGRIIIEKGYLRALEPGGSIRYIANEASKALATSSPELGLALDLLSDFQYQVLSSEVELDQEGNLLLGLSLAGKNPSQYQGRPVNFNINLEQNLDPLLQSLRLSDNLVEKIEGRLQ
ncbi:MAG: YdbH domain-containing protein [Halioglobus sp.]